MEGTGNLCLGTKALVQQKVSHFLAGLADRNGRPIAAAYRRSLPPGSSTKLSRASRHWVLLVRLGRPPGLTPPAGSRSNSPVRTMLPSVSTINHGFPTR